MVLKLRKVFLTVDSKLILEKWLKTHRLTIKILKLAMMGSVSVFFVLVYFLKIKTGLQFSDHKNLIIVFYGLALVSLFGVNYLRKYSYSDLWIQKNLKSDTNIEILSNKGNSNIANQQLLNDLKQLSVMDLKLFSLSQKYMGLYILSLAVCESIAIYGLVYYLLGAFSKDVLPFFIISIGMMFWNQPQHEMVLQKASKIYSKNIL